MNGKPLRKKCLHEKLTASVLLKLFIGGNERCHTTDATSAWAAIQQRSTIIVGKTIIFRIKITF